jgi:MtN3 and saliva related transmembrane protein
VVLVVGTLAAVLTTGCWVPQLTRTIRRGSAEDFSWPYLLLLIAGVTSWFVYGILKRDPPIYVCNGLVVLSIAVVIVVKSRSRAELETITETAQAGGASPADRL